MICVLLIYINSTYTIAGVYENPKHCIDSAAATRGARVRLSAFLGLRCPPGVSPARQPARGRGRSQFLRQMFRRTPRWYGGHDFHFRTVFFAACRR